MEIFFTDLMEIHVLELRKQLKGEGRLDSWIRLFNAETEEDLDMIRTEHAGIAEAVRELKSMGLIGFLREEYEYRQKWARDRRAEDAYVRAEAQAQMAKLYLYLKEQGRIDEYERALLDKEYLEKLLKEIDG